MVRPTFLSITLVANFLLSIVLCELDAVAQSIINTMPNSAVAPTANPTGGVAPIPSPSSGWAPSPGPVPGGVEVITTQASAVVDGEIINDASADRYTATGGVSRTNGTNYMGRHVNVKLLDPRIVRPKFAQLGGGSIYQDSVGSNSYDNIRGVISNNFTSSPYVGGFVSPQTTAGGSLFARPKAMIAGVPQGEVRFQMIDQNAAVVVRANESGSSELRGSRSTFQGTINGVFLPTQPPAATDYFEADLVLTVRYGADGDYVRGTTTTYSAGRQVDLDINGPTFHIAIRAPGATLPSPYVENFLPNGNGAKGFGWSDRNSLATSVVGGFTSFVSIPQQTINWRNGPVINNPLNPAGTIGPWSSQTMRFKVKLQATWVIQVSALTQNISKAQQTGVGRVRVPAPGGLGNGVDVSVWIDPTTVKRTQAP